MEIILKDGRKITIERTNSENLEGGKGSYIVYDENKKDIGILRYRYDKKAANLDFLAVSDKAYLGCGVGHKLLYEFEKDMAKTDAKRIIGVYSPMGAGAERTKKFYERHGYQFARDKKNGDLLVVKKVGARMSPAKYRIVTTHEIIR